MRFRAAAYVLVPALTLMGCASQKTVDAGPGPARQELDELKQSQAALARAQEKLEARLARLEGDSALNASRLDQLAPMSEALKRQVGSLETQAAATQSGLSALAEKVAQQGASLAQLGGELKQQADGLRTQAAATQASLSTLSNQVEQQATLLAQARETAEDAVKIARDSRMVSGKIVDTLTLTQDMVLYSYEQPELTAKGREAMNGLIASVKPLMPHAFIEIIGFSDDFSLGSHNRQIALERAESVRRYLHEVGGIPLHRMSTISYGDLKPLADNVSLEGRIQNRRVVVQVLK